ncbi:flagellar hook-basal body complex protein FliE [Sphingomonas gilva]|uniref:Flagellar hook-basal body complex protein FliE n=2 Tax=Sphingomonas gilva TaxID=2305907 RepID=A0A396RWW1_9SPHN|nr:flagellar hook-basal body complex protein FliE [Sphingomonas gilva]
MTGSEYVALQPHINPAPQAPSASFGDMIMQGLQRVDARIDKADALVRQFAVDDTVPVHQVTMALEEARLAVELAMQVRTRLVEGYRELMNMQI